MQILSETPLCPSCLGRQFATLLKGFTNSQRGLSIITSLVAELQHRIESGDESARGALEKIAPSLPESFRGTLEHLGVGHPGRRPCWLCNDRIDGWLDLYKEAARMLVEVRADSFVVGVVAGRDLVRREDELWRRYEIVTGESIKSEIKREIGKRVQAKTGIPVDFSNPGVVVLAKLDTSTVDVVVNPIKIYGVYLKTGRNLSQTRWVARNGGRRYELSVQDMLEPIRQYYEGTDVILHASGREDVDARMLGTGRPMVVEVKDPAHRSTPLEYLEYLVNERSRWARFAFYRRAERADVRRTKAGDALRSKTYKALVFASSPIDESTLREIERRLTNATISQRTPLRVVHRRPDIVRRKVVYEVKTRYYTPQVFEAIIRSEGGVYIKELVSGDGGRTQPSFSSIAEVEMRCIELDVLEVDEQGI